MRRLLKFAGRKPRSRTLVQAPVPDLQDAQLAAAYYDQRTGGDLHDFLRVGPTRVLFGLLDVAGRLDENREIVSAARDTFRSIGAEVFAQEDINEADAMIELCVQLNRGIMNTAGRACSSPAFAGCYNESLGTVCYVNAGHTPGLLRDESGVSELHATGLPLGLFSHSAADAIIVALQPGAALVLVSRGVVEAKRKAEEYGLDQVKDDLQRARTETAQDICADILGRVQEFTNNTRRHNDVTVLALARHA
ncbi:MAG: SpoIIE family protein phosphatase [Acidobacteriia bacterium]|nr:SpoIIE family protein phosphatase [Terriglobia bacterium]